MPGTHEDDRRLPPWEERAGKPDLPPTVCQRCGGPMDAHSLGEMVHGCRRDLTGIPSVWYNVRVHPGQSGAFGAKGGQMAQKETPKPLTKAEITKIRSEVAGLLGKLSAVVDQIHTEGFPAKTAQAVKYQVGMVRYGVRQGEALVASLDSLPSKAPAKPKAAAAK